MVIVFVLKTIYELAHVRRRCVLNALLRLYFTEQPGYVAIVHAVFVVCLQHDFPASLVACCMEDC